MSIEKPLREMVQAELKTRLAPMHKAIARMDARLGVIAEIVDIIHRLAPMATRMQTLQMALPGIGLPIQGRGKQPVAPPPAPAPAPRQAAPAPRQAAPPPPPAAPTPPARPPLSYPTSRYALPTTAAPVYKPEPAPSPAPAPRGRPPARAAAEAPSARVSEGGRRCAVIGCKRPARSKGYCSAHYQKLRLLVKSGRRPASWVDDAPSQSVAEVVLPRGRAASKARGEAPAPAPAAPVRPEPPKPKVWVRKKGAKDSVAPLH
ncbi:hypothetical protein CYFUS_009677 [Cystobacter fuscus]|uniref:Vegetative protein n=1 Tax=Cystobacter fuscus TaxID=43 RepID=A0A250JKN5_9BACT|nr:hypothetical protein [Cystobacter fuscus]ATB44190.1 hypothetical protein CYFUS_009677 [Cystobacter fuscus]